MNTDVSLIPAYSITAVIVMLTLGILDNLFNWHDRLRKFFEKIWLKVSLDARLKYKRKKAIESLKKCNEDFRKNPDSYEVRETIRNDMPFSGDAGKRRYCIWLVKKTPDYESWKKDLEDAQNLYQIALKNGNIDDLKRIEEFIDSYMSKILNHQSYFRQMCERICIGETEICGHPIVSRLYVADFVDYVKE